MSDDTDDNISPSVHLGQSQLQLNVPFTRSHANANEPIPGGHMRHSLKRTSSLFSAYSHQDNIASMERFAWHSDQFGSARNRRGRFYVPLHLTPLRSFAVLSLRWIILCSRTAIYGTETWSGMCQEVLVISLQLLAEDWTLLTDLLSMSVKDSGDANKSVSTNSQ